MDFNSWLESVPFVTRHWFMASIILPLLGRFGFISVQWMYLDWNLVVNRFQFWRPLTALIFYPVTPQTGFHWLMMLYFLYNYSKNLESDTFRGRPADYLFMLIVNWFVCTSLCLAIGTYFMLEPMVLSILYVWCMVNKETIVSFWFGMRFPAKYLPWALAGFNVVLRGGGMNEFLGILVGHTYYFLSFKYPLDHGGSPLIHTPEFLYTLLPSEDGGIHTAGGAAPRAPPRPRGHAWGGHGAQLGGN